MTGRARKDGTGGPVGFERGRNAGTKVCAGCGKRVWKHSGQGTDFCERCYERAGLENEHTDNGHEVSTPNCPLCEAQAASPG
jgi:hypothetical protein